MTFRQFSGCRLSTNLQYLDIIELPSINYEESVAFDHVIVDNISMVIACVVIVVTVAYNL